MVGKGAMDFVEQLKSSVDIVTVIGEYVRLLPDWIDETVDLPSMASHHDCWEGLSRG